MSGKREGGLNAGSRRPVVFHRGGGLWAIRSTGGEKTEYALDEGTC